MKNAPAFLLALALSSAAATANETWFPLAPGSEWRYLRVEGGGDRVSETHAVESTAPDGPWTMATVAVFVGEGQPLSERILYGRRDGVTYRLGRGSEGRAVTYDPPLPILERQMEVGRSWTWRGTERWEEAGKEPRSVAAAIETTVEAVEEVRVRAGTFRAYRVREEHTGSGVSTIRWYAEGVGIVQEKETDGRTEIYVMKLEERRPGR